jgi:thiol:disulfide interchange protein DsbD
VWRLALIGVLACAAEHPQHPWLGIAIDEAKDADKPLVVEFYAEWCKPCHLFADSVLPDPRVQVALRDVMFLRYDIDTTTGRDAMRRCRVRGVPTVVGIDHAGFVRVKKTGTEPTADEFLVFLRQARTALTSKDPPPAP